MMIQITALLREGAGNATKSEVLQAYTGLTDTEVRRLIRSERLKGSPICSNNAGFFLPVSKIELMATIESLKEREKEINVTRSALEKSLHRLYDSTEEA